MAATWLWVLWLGAGYLAGSIPFALLLGWCGGVDIRRQGSGNVGASNLGRALGKGWGVGCFALDAGKGLLPVLVYGLTAGLIGGGAGYISGDVSGGGAGALRTLGWVLVAAGAMVGHVFPVWLRFKGGKGVATGMGAMLGLYPLLTAAGLAAGVIWYATIRASGYISVASLAAAGAMPVLAGLAGLAFGAGAGEVLVLVGVTLLLGGLVVWRHRDNIARLRAGTEEKVTWAGR